MACRIRAWPVSATASTSTSTSAPGGKHSRRYRSHQTLPSISSTAKPVGKAIRIPLRCLPRRLMIARDRAPAERWADRLEAVLARAGYWPGRFLPGPLYARASSCPGPVLNEVSEDCNAAVSAPVDRTRTGPHGLRPNRAFHERRRPAELRAGRAKGHDRGPDDHYQVLYAQGFLKPGRWRRSARRGPHQRAG